MGIGFPKLEEIIKECSDPNWAVFACMGNRIGLSGWMTQVEYTWFRPDTRANEDFNLTLMKWPDDFPIPWTIVRIPREYEDLAKAVLWQHGLKVGGSKDPEGGSYTFLMMDHNGTHEFPLFGPNVFCLENHSDGASNVAYTNDPEKIAAANEHEKEIVARYHAEHDQWLKEHYAKAEAYWASRPDIYPPEKKPKRPDGSDFDITRGRDDRP